MGNEKSRFLKRDDGTIYDSLTSVTWMANDSRLDMDKEVSYAETEEYLKKINEKKIGGYDDWRIPTIHEASSIYDKEKLNKDFKGGDIHLDSIFPPWSGDLHLDFINPRHRSSNPVLFERVCLLVRQGGQNHFPRGTPRPSRQHLGVGPAAVIFFLSLLGG